MEQKNKYYFLKTISNSKGKWCPEVYISYYENDFSLVKKVIKYLFSKGEYTVHFIDYDYLDQIDEEIIKRLLDKVSFVIFAVADIISANTNDFFYYFEYQYAYSRDIRRIFIGESYTRMFDELQSIYRVDELFYNNNEEEDELDLGNDFISYLHDQISSLANCRTAFRIFEYVERVKPLLEDRQYYILSFKCLDAIIRGGGERYHYVEILSYYIEHFREGFHYLYFYDLAERLIYLMNPFYQNTDYSLIIRHFPLIKRAIYKRAIYLAGIPQKEVESNHKKAIKAYELIALYFNNYLVMKCHAKDFDNIQNEYEELLDFIKKLAKPGLINEKLMEYRILEKITSSGYLLSNYPTFILSSYQKSLELIRDLSSIKDSVNYVPMDALKTLNLFDKLPSEFKDSYDLFSYLLEWLLSSIKESELNKEIITKNISIRLNIIYYYLYKNNGVEIKKWADDLYEYISGLISKNYYINTFQCDECYHVFSLMGIEVDIIRQMLNDFTSHLSDLSEAIPFKKARMIIESRALIECYINKDEDGFLKDFSYMLGHYDSYDELKKLLSVTHSYFKKVKNSDVDVLFQDLISLLDRKYSNNDKPIKLHLLNDYRFIDIYLTVVLSLGNDNPLKGDLMYLLFNKINHLIEVNSLQLDQKELFSYIMVIERIFIYAKKYFLIDHYDKDRLIKMCQKIIRCERKYHNGSIYELFEATYRIGKVHFIEKNYQLAIRYLQKSLNLFKEKKENNSMSATDMNQSFDALMLLGKSYFELKDNKKAVKSFKQAYQLFINNLTDFRNRENLSLVEEIMKCDLSKNDFAYFNNLNMTTHYEDLNQCLDVFNYLINYHNKKDEKQVALYYLKEKKRMVEKDFYKEEALIRRIIIEILEYSDYFDDKFDVVIYKNILEEYGDYYG